MEGLQSGIVNVALEWVYQQTGLDPLFSGIIGNITATTIEAVLDKKDVMGHILDSTDKFLFKFSQFGYTGNDPLSLAIYNSKLLDFATLVTEKGLLSAFEQYITSMLQQETIDMIIKDGGIAAMLTGRAEIRYDERTGREVKRIWFDLAKTHYADIDNETGYPIEKYENINGIDVRTTHTYTFGAEGGMVITGYEVDAVYPNGAVVNKKYDSNNKLLSLSFEGDNGNFDTGDMNGELVFRQKQQPCYRGFV
jgi:hypothetical protein